MGMIPPGRPLDPPRQYLLRGGFLFLENMRYSIWAMRIKKPLNIIFYGLVGIFATIGLLFTAVFLLMQFDLLNVRGEIEERNEFFGEVPEQTVACITGCPWKETSEWAVVKAGLAKDRAVIDRVSRETGVSSRMIAAVVVPEQIRFFTSNREIFKAYFEPLKILGSLSQFSLGVSGIKQETARKVEEYAASSTSSFYPGVGMNPLIAYPDSVLDRDGELFNRLTDEDNHYYSYLYTALYIKEIQEQWRRAGFDIQKKPEVVATLFNIGFGGSKPNANPEAGGSLITVGGTRYPYGKLGAEFYNSSELADFFKK